MLGGHHQIRGAAPRRSSELPVASCVGARIVAPLPQPLIPDATLRADSIVGGAHLELRIPPGYTSGPPTHGCYTARSDALLYGPNWRQVCVRILTPAGADSLAFDIVTRETNLARGAHLGCFDCRTYTDVATDTLPWRSRGAVVQRGLVTGGLEGFSRVPAILVRVPLDRWVVVVAAEVGDAEYFAQVLGMAQSAHNVGLLIR